MLSTHAHLPRNEGIYLFANTSAETGDDCGAANQKQLIRIQKRLFQKGTHYADVVDTDNGNQNVGVYVYDFTNGYGLRGPVGGIFGHLHGSLSIVLATM